MKKSIKSILDETEIFYDYFYKKINKKTLIFLHGWCCNRSFWKNQINYFSNEYNIITIDMAGHGDSGFKSRTDWSIDTLASDVASVIQAERIEDVILIGHSMADNITLHLTKFKTFSITGIIGIDNFYQIAEPVSEELREEVIAYFDKDYLGGLKETVLGWFVDPKKEIDLVNQVYDQMKKVPEKVSRSVGIFTLDKLPYEFTKSINFPIKVIACTKWTDDRAEKLYNMFNYVEIIDMIPKSGHFPMLDRTKEFNAILKETIANIDSVIMTE
jgi:pimeloyl-ACP methyl ester carboxylesterase